MSPARGAGLARPRLALALLALLLLSTLGTIGLIEPTETRYAEIAREMRASGDWLIPRLDGIPHFDKPPLAYWAAALGMGALGENRWGARVPALLATLASLAFAALAARRRFASLGAGSAATAWVMGTMLLTVSVGRALATDPFLAAAVCGFWALAPSPWAAALVGVGFLAKGPVVLVATLLPLVTAAIWNRSRAPFLLLRPAWGWLAALAIGLPWFVVVARRTPGLARYLVENQLWQRYVTTVHHRRGPPWYFVAVLLAGALPWTPALIAGIGRALRSRDDSARLAVCWLLAPLVFFSFSGSKLPAYLLPCVPAAALLATRELERGGRDLRRACAALLVALALAGWMFGPRALASLAGFAGGRGALPLAAHLGLALLLVAALLALGGRVAASAFAVALAWTGLFSALAPYQAALGSPAPLVRVLAENRAAGEPVVEFAQFNAGVPFYLGERVPLLEVPREDLFASTAERNSTFLDRNALSALAASHSRVWIVGPERASSALADSLALRYQAVARGRRTVVGLLTR